MNRCAKALLLALAAQLLSGCANRGTGVVTLVNVKLPPGDEICGVVTVGGEEVDFDVEAVIRGGRTITRCWAEIRGDTLFARYAGEPFEIALADVCQLRLAPSDGLPTPLALLIGVTMLVGVPFLLGR